MDGKTCEGCKHEHKGVCDCGCKMCPECKHEHNADGTCVCGCK